MDELFESDADIIGVRNNNSLDQAGAHGGITIPHHPPFGDGSPIPLQGFINAGLIAANNSEFWDVWHDINSQVAATKGYGWGDENDTLNHIFHWDKFTSEVIDPIGSGVSYGLSNIWGTGDNHWESWSQIYVKNDRLYLDDPKTGEPMCIKVLQAGGSIAGELNKNAGGFRNWLSSVVPPEVDEYIKEVCNG